MQKVLQIILAGVPLFFLQVAQAQTYPETCDEFEEKVLRLAPQTTMGEFVTEIGEEGYLAHNLFSIHNFQKCSFRVFWIFSEEQIKVLRSFDWGNNDIAENEFPPLSDMIIYAVWKEIEMTADPATWPEGPDEFVVWPQTLKGLDLNTLYRLHYEKAVGLIDTIACEVEECK